MSELALFVRNFRQNGKGTVEEIGFEEFLVVMSHFRPPSLHMTEDQRESVRREKLRCVCHKSHDHLLVNDSQLVKLIRAFSAVLFNMHDTDNDGTITLEEYRHVSLCLSLPQPRSTRGFVVLSIFQSSYFHVCPGGGGAVVSQRGTGEGDGQKHS